MNLLGSYISLPAMHSSTWGDHPVCSVPQVFCPLPPLNPANLSVLAFASDSLSFPVHSIGPDAPVCLTLSILSLLSSKWKQLLLDTSGEHWASCIFQSRGTLSQSAGI